MLGLGLGIWLGIRLGVRVRIRVKCMYTNKCVHTFKVQG